MAKYSRADKVSSQTQAEAMKIARGTQKPGQTKEQTKLIAQGIQKGIDQYKKQYKIKVRELDRKLKKVSQQQDSAQAETQEIVIHKQSWLAWILLALSWISFAAYFVFYSYN
jgi:flagellar biosynthesis/type III secretory pathway protein FliH